LNTCLTKLIGMTKITTSNIGDWIPRVPNHACWILPKSGVVFSSLAFEWQLKSYCPPLMDLWW
jgi:hypothetical protein